MEYEFFRKDTKKVNSEGVVFKHLYVCTRGFKSSQGLGSQKHSCETSKAKKLKQENYHAMVVYINQNTTIFSSNRPASEIWNQMKSDSRRAKYKRSTDVSNINEAKLDGRNNNRGCDMIRNWYSWKKVEVFMKCSRKLMRYKLQLWYSTILVLINVLLKKWRGLETLCQNGVSLIHMGNILVIYWSTPNHPI